MTRRWGGLGVVALAAGLVLGAWWMPRSPSGGPPATAPAEAAPATRLARASPAMLPVALAAEPAASTPAREGRRTMDRYAALDALIAAARQGDAQAAHAAYRGLAACLGPDAPRCPGLPASLLQERMRFLAQAMHAGLPQAQLDFYFEGPDLGQAQDAASLQAWRAEALAGLQAAAARCEPLAAGVLATQYDSGELSPRDPGLAVAYAVAEGRLRGRPTSDASLRDRLAEPIDDAALAAARQQGLALAAACR
ncbi:MAG: hypothetical protein EKK53_14570 [Burkholderiales bacterium]|nr:MAG: hypothetical protein EKK53_14570 [Burkholderiales bacterium]